MNAKIIVKEADRHFYNSETNEIFYPAGVNYFRPEQGWAPKFWIKFDEKNTEKDFELLNTLGFNCVRIFITYNSFCKEPGIIEKKVLHKFDKILELGDKYKIYIHPTGPDHWEGAPLWTRTDQYSNLDYINTICTFWKQFVTIYKGRNTILGYDLKNEPRISWSNSIINKKWLEYNYKKPSDFFKNINIETANWDQFNKIHTTIDKNNTTADDIIKFQIFRENEALFWAEKQYNTIKNADPEALITTGLHQTSFPAGIPAYSDYSGFNPLKIAKYSDFISYHYYPNITPENYQYKNKEELNNNLTLLDFISNFLFNIKKPVMLGEFGWYSGPPPIDMQKLYSATTSATEPQQAEFNMQILKITSRHASGWLNWGLYDHPDATDVTSGTGILTAEGKIKKWGKTYSEFSKIIQNKDIHSSLIQNIDFYWDKAISDDKYRNEFYQKLNSNFSIDSIQYNKNVLK